MLHIERAFLAPNVCVVEKPETDHICVVEKPETDHMWTCHTMYVYLYWLDL